MEAVIVVGLSIIPSFSWLLFCALRERSFDRFIKRCCWFFFFSSVGEEAERKGETKNKKTFHQLFDVRSESFFFAKLKNIFADWTRKQKFYEMRMRILWLFSQRRNVGRTTRKGTKMPSFEKSEMFSVVRQKLTTQKAEKQFYSRDC